MNWLVKWCKKTLSRKWGLISGICWLYSHGSSTQNSWKLRKGLTKKLKSYLGFTSCLDIYIHTHICTILFWNKKYLFSFRLGYNLREKSLSFQPRTTTNGMLLLQNIPIFTLGCTEVNLFCSWGSSGWSHCRWHSCTWFPSPHLRRCCN